MTLCTASSTFLPLMLKGMSFTVKALAGTCLGVQFFRIERNYLKQTRTPQEIDV